MENAPLMEQITELDGLATSAFEAAAPVPWPQRRRQIATQVIDLGKAGLMLPRRARELAHLCTAQGRLIFPGQWTQGHAKAQFRTPDHAERLTLTGSRGDRIHALFAKALSPDGSPHPLAAHRPTLLFFYGNDMYLAATVHIVERLRRSGCNVMVPEYVGFGLSKGRPSEAACYDTADAACAHLMRRRDIDHGKIVSSGCSLGGAVAIDLASRQNVAGLITLVTFTSIPDVARHTHPHVPIGWFIRHRFESVKKMPSVLCPALIGHSTGDRLIPYEMADQLAAAAGGPVERLVIEGANHKSTEMLEVGGEVIFRSIREFLGRITPGVPASAEHECVEIPTFS